MTRLARGPPVLLGKLFPGRPVYAGMSRQNDPFYEMTLRAMHLLLPIIADAARPERRR